MLCEWNHKLFCNQSNKCSSENTNALQLVIAFVMIDPTKPGGLTPDSLDPPLGWNKNEANQRSTFKEREGLKY